MKIYTSLKALESAMREQITRTPQQARKALLRICEYQTQSEIRVRSVISRNGCGFKPQDARLLTGIAAWCKAGKELTPSQFEAVKGRIAKYAAQLVRHSIEKGLIRKEGKVYTYCHAA